MSGLLERIYLQVYCEEEGFKKDEEIPWDQITWHKDSVFNDDIEYVLASKLTQLLEACKTVQRMLITRWKRPWSGAEGAIVQTLENAIDAVSDNLEYVLASELESVEKQRDQLLEVCWYLLKLESVEKDDTENVDNFFIHLHRAYDKAKTAIAAVEDGI